MRLASESNKSDLVIMHLSFAPRWYPLGCSAAGGPLIESLPTGSGSWELLHRTEDLFGVSRSLHKIFVFWHAQQK